MLWDVSGLYHFIVRCVKIYGMCQGYILLWDISGLDHVTLKCARNRLYYGMCQGYIIL